jgi:AhpD family alkylhydroperoxidase
MTRFEIHSIDSAPQGARPTLEAAKERFGFLPNLLGEFAAAPPALEAYVTLNGLLEKTSLSPVEQQLVLLAVSVANGCDYCVAAHTAGLKQSGFDADELEAARSGRSGSP